MILDTVQSKVIFDSEARVTLSITAASNGVLTSTNSLVLQANTVKFANTSQICILDVIGIQYASSIANGWISLEYVNSGGNSTIVVLGRNSSGGMGVYWPNPNTAVAGDINLNIAGMAAKDSFSLVVDLRKNDFNGAFANMSNPWNAIQSTLY